MATNKRNSKKASSLAVDFSDTETQKIVDEGDYVVEVDEIERKTSDNSGEDYLSWKFKITDGEFKGKALYHNTSLQPQALFNLRGVLEALGIEVPQGKMELDPADLIGETCGVAVAHEKYQGKTKARPVEFFPADQVGEDREAEEEKPAKGKAKNKPEDDEPEEKPAKKGAAAKKGKPEPEEEEEAKPAAKKKAKAKPEPEEPEFEVDDEVTFEDDEGNEQTGVITEIDDDEITVKVGKGKKATEWTLEPSDLTKVEAD